eukprot:TRINITY_DN23432_c0_g1_i1.p1 TRINITY_DN23432_c0_g1~~TRINITY_DN23432_c0_g1_i1.p1  ORF type:complete len:532 (-),score=81.15 TRINITY_DN23432_c0_g1_i1:203-1798(-)
MAETGVRESGANSVSGTKLTRWHAWLLQAGLAYLVQLQGCSLADVDLDIAEISAKLVQGDALELLQRSCPNHFMHGEDVKNTLAKLMMRRQSQMESCPVQVSQVLQSLLSPSGEVKEYFSQELSSYNTHWLKHRHTETQAKLGMGNSSLSFSVHATKAAVDSFIATVANATCDTELFTYMSMSLDTQYLPYMEREERQKASEEMQKEFAQVIDSQLQVAVAAGLMSQLAEHQATLAQMHAPETAQDAFVLFCAAPEEMKDYACSMVDGRTQPMNGKSEFELLFGLASRSEGSHAEMVANTLSSVSWQGMSLSKMEAREYPDASLREKLDDRVEFCEQILSGKRQRAAPPQLEIPYTITSAGVTAEFNVDLRGGLLQSAQDGMDKRLCWQVMPWISTHLELNATAPDKFRSQLKQQVLLWQQALLREALGCRQSQHGNNSARLAWLQSIPVHARRWLARHTGVHATIVADRSPTQDQPLEHHMHLSRVVAPACCLLVIVMTIASCGIWFRKRTSKPALSDEAHSDAWPDVAE